MDLGGWGEGPGTRRAGAHTGVSALFPVFLQGNGEVTDDLCSYESTRCPVWPANSFMVSVTDSVGARGGVLTPLPVNST
ncbi:hypothetical protein LK07_28165 [Streptomyces pluripotens]|uniref:Uncharacterized protein n=1 Tax=Streptomyces pluripotens TaxID=1355015 RepID=A0A221P5G9_9ACTN|nr:hypothetical protein LK06_027000 [Streptomyces pluripotens]ASN27268.1 hypothetical protein LK07_28165 [Streptomyces pluripotens]